MNALLSDRISVARRFTRAVRVDTDLADAGSLEGYVCSQSAIESLLQMARHHEMTGHGAFTWTGPYGSGKSSLAVALTVLLSGDEARAAQLLRQVRRDDRKEIVRAFRKTDARWSVAAVVGRREDPSKIIAESLRSLVSGRKELARGRGEALHAWAGRIAADESHAGLVLIIDEMGKVLEAAARDAGDVYLFQELAETASRSHGRLMVVGILHQAFDEYAHRLAREARDEWLKVQGRFLDIPISLVGEEQLDLIGRAIEGSKPAARPEVGAIAEALKGTRLGDAAALEARLAACWPLHPIVAALLGPISRRRFGQNQRSLFGFLNSAEPLGFQAFLQETPNRDDSVYPISRLWSYLHSNLEPAILASPDGHRWSTALEAVERAEAKSADASHLAVLKAVALIDLFKDRSGLQATLDVLRTVVPDGVFVEALLEDLKRWSVVIYRAHTGAFAIYAGSDFDIEAAIDETRRAGSAVNYRRLAQCAALQPILAKRHYEETGALRWFEVELAPLHEAEDRVRVYKPAPGAAGLFLLTISTKAELEGEAKRVLQRAVEQAGNRLVVCGWSQDSYMIREMAGDLAALEHVRANRPELEGDAIARREVDARIARISADLEDRLSGAIDRVQWTLPPAAGTQINARAGGPAGLSVLASRLAAWRYGQAPRIRNELLNRTRPSSNAQAAVRALLKAMVLKGSEPRLGIDGYPPELGLYMSVLEAPGIHRLVEERGHHGFAAPREGESRLGPMWEATDAWVSEREGRVTAAELYQFWHDPPFGLRHGLAPVLLLAYLLSRSVQSVVYLDDVFRPSLDTLFVDRLLQDPSKVSFRLVELSEVDVGLIADMAEMLSTSKERVPPTPIEVARALIADVRGLPNWTQRTSRLTAQALKLRDRAKISDDPNRLLLEDLPAAVGAGKPGGDSLSARVNSLLNELRNAYPRMLSDLEKVLLGELRVRRRDDVGLAAIRRRAEKVRNLTGNYRLDAMATRLTQYSGTIEDIEGLASLAANKPPRDWVDRDVDNARVELAALAQQFLKAELFVRLKGRTGGGVALGIYISDPRYPEPQAREVELTEGDREAAELLSARISALLKAEKASRDLALAALANVGLSLDGSEPALPEAAE